MSTIDHPQLPPASSPTRPRSRRAVRLRSHSMPIGTPSVPGVMPASLGETVTGAREAELLPGD